MHFTCTHVYDDSFRVSVCVKFGEVWIPILDPRRILDLELWVLVEFWDPNKILDLNGSQLISLSL